MKKPPLFILFFNLTYLITAVYMCSIKSNFEFIIYIGVVFIVILTLLYIDHRIPLSRMLLWLMSLWGLAHMAGGLINVPLSWPTAGETQVLYNWWLIEDIFKFDQLVHAYGFGLCTWLLWNIVRFAIAKSANKDIKDIIPSFGLLFLCALGAMGLGAANEVVEFVVMLNIPETNVGGYENTGWDLVANTIGSLFVAALLWSGRKRKI